ncbi:MAG: Ig-like domain-containing protein, partial [Flavobacteriaceae bacterium]
MGILTENITNGNVANYPKVFAKDDTSASLEDRARTYLDVNCASCHNPNVNNVAQFDARFTTPLENQNIIYGDVSYDLGLENPKVIAPRDVANSVAHVRMNSMQTGVKMPPLAKGRIDVEGVELIQQWVNSLVPEANHPPMAVLSASVTYGPAPLVVNFDGTQSSDEDGDTLTYLWDFGNGTTATQNTVSHTFDQPGSYTVTLTVSDGQESNQASTQISVNDSDPGNNIVNFTDATNLLNGSNRSGVAMAIVDMNNDGKDDLVQFNSGKNIRIQYQKGPGETFDSYSFGQVSSRNQWSTCVADFDQNGYNDILSGGYYDGVHVISNNNGNNSYTKQTISNSSIFIQGSNFADINNDGWADIFACHDDAESAPFRNNANGTFTRDANLIRTFTVPTSDNSGNYASMWIDYDNDRDLDLYISKCRGGVTDPNDPRRINMLWQNDGNNNFTEVAAQANLKIGDQTWLTDFGDIDNDGDLDALVINHYTNPNLMRNNGNGTFTDITASSGLLPTLSSNNIRGIQASFRDFNNDGYLDLLVTGNAHYLYYNNGDGTFTNVTNPFNSNEIHSFSVGDLNHDGFLDIYAGYGRGYNTPTSITDRVWLNEGNDFNFIAVQLEGTDSNINGIGARVEVHGAWGIQIRDVRSGEGYGLMNSFTQHFGIGPSTQIDKVVVHWPSGNTDEILNPDPNQFLKIKENMPIPVVGVSLDRTDITLEVGQITNLAASVAPSNATNANISWSSNNTDVVTVDTHGEITAVGQGTATITVTTEDGNFTATANITVIVPVIGVSISPTSDTLEVGQTTNLTATVEPANANNTDISWSSSDTDIATVNANGRVTAISEGSATITVTTDDGDFTATADITVVIPVTGVSVSPTSSTLEVGQTTDLTATIEPSNATNTTVSWSSSDSDVATVDSNGKITAIGSGAATITVTTEDGDLTATADITVVIPVTGVNVSPTSRTLEVGQTATLTATVEPANATNTNISWSSSDADIATVNTDGLVTAIAEGSTTITVTTDDGNFTATATITVEPATVPVTGVTVSPVNATLTEGDTQQLSASVSPSNATDMGVSWSSSDTDVATVSTNGLVTAILEGNATITVTTDDGDFTATATITVEAATISVTGVTVSPVNATLTEGDTQQLSATVSPNNATDTGVSWSSSDTDVATVSSNGHVTAISEGNATITVTTDDGNFTATAAITVEAALGDNLALNKPAVQSSTHLGGTADRAVDGNRSGVFNDNSVTHSQLTDNPWWRVDLGAVYNIAQIDVYNRTDACCSTRLAGAKVYVGLPESNDPSDYTFVKKLNNDALQST